jgi:hypothetical protein
MFPLLGPEIIKWLVDRCAQPDERLTPSFMDELISGSGTDIESAEYGTFTKQVEK